MVKVAVAPELIHGDVDEGYGPVADAFRRNFAERGEIGAACTVYRGGRKVVDLWGGYRDGVKRLPWQADTVVVMYSTTKGVSSLALALAHSRGLLDYDERVAAYWPEFGWRGKGGITVRQLLSHQAGLPIVDVPLTVADLGDLDFMAAALAIQRPLWAAGTRHGYHTITLGWYESELLRRVDPGGRSIGRYFADEIAGPLGLSFYIGLPDDFDMARRATIHGRGNLQMMMHLRDYPTSTLLAMMKPGSPVRRSLSNPPELVVDTAFNTDEMLRVEIPAGNGIGEPRAVAAAYDAALTGKLGITAGTLEALVQPARAPSGGTVDEMLRTPISFSLGYLKPTPDAPFGSAANSAFGTPGNGGSFGFADPDTGIGYCYAPNRLGFGLLDRREIALRDALYRDVLGERSQRPGNGDFGH
ncbi:serine hydrolase domain-containing protein [Paractinoplanes durhamensis]|uniref:Esterase n=2 Tax=Paractinoplanes durhamensis TaxID=113563 RepID=A0ABQ3YPS7_9ACTN|nr:serine hydrolase domain-containing protein [Actinoplanes durhamensis]GID99556.1 esterase [Actinoplanes durhamensis]